MALQRKANHWQFELPPGCVEMDFTGAAHDALVTMIDHSDAEKLKRAILATIQKYGATNNQRMLFQSACESLKEDEHPEVEPCLVG